MYKHLSRNTFEMIWVILKMDKAGILTNGTKNNI